MNPSLVNTSLAIMAPVPLIQTGVAYFIQDLVPDVECVIMASSLEQLQAQWVPQQIGLLVVVLSGLPEMWARDVQQLLQFSEQEPALHIVVYTYCRDALLLTRLQRRPHVSLIARQESLEQTRCDMSMALSGVKVCSPSIQACLQAMILPSSTLDNLTQAECKVLQHLQQGMNLSSIASLLHRSIKTISAHKCNSMRKLGVQTDVELFRRLQGLLIDKQQDSLPSVRQGAVR